MRICSNETWSESSHLINSSITLENKLAHTFIVSKWKCEGASTRCLTSTRGLTSMEHSRNKPPFWSIISPQIKPARGETKNLTTCENSGNKTMQRTTNKDLLVQQQNTRCPDCLRSKEKRRQKQTHPPVHKTGQPGYT